MAMRTSAKFLSRRLLSGARNFSENAKTVDFKAESANIKEVQRLSKEVEKLTTDMDSYMYKLQNVKMSNRTYLNLTNAKLIILGCTSSIGGYFWGTMCNYPIDVEDDD